MPATHVIAYSQDTTLSESIAEFLVYEGVPATPYTSQVDLFDTIRATQPEALILVQPASDPGWLVRLAEMIHWDPAISTEVIVATHRPELCELHSAARSGYISAIFSVPFDYDELTSAVKSAIERAATPDVHHAPATPGNLLHRASRLQSSTLD